DFYRALVEHRGDAMALVHRDGTVRFVTESATQLAGARPSEMGGSPCERIHPEDMPRVCRAFADCAQQADNRVSIEYRAHVDGAWRHYEVSAINRLNDPVLGSIVVSYRDITARKLAESTLAESERVFAAT